MIGENVEPEDSDSNLTQPNVVKNKCLLLKYNNKQVQDEIRNCFAQLTTLLQLRERQLLHRAQSLQAQEFSAPDNLYLQSALTFNTDNVKDLQEQISHFGKVAIVNKNDSSKTIEVGYHKNCNNYYTAHKTSPDEEQNRDILKKQIKIINTRKPYLVDFDKMCANLSNLCKSNFMSNVISKSLLMHRLPVLRGLSNMPIIISNSVTSPTCSSLLKIEQDEGTKNSDTGTVNLSQGFLLDNIYEVRMDFTRTTESLTTTNAPETSFKIDDIKPHINTQSKPYNDLSTVYSNVESSNEFATDSQNSISTTITSTSKNHEVLRNAGMHPKQIQYWLQQILVETEIEPMVHEIGQFSEISEARFYNEFPVET